MVVTRSQSKQKVRSPRHTIRGDDNEEASGAVSDTPHIAPTERLGRGCRIPRPAPASYDALYVTKALLPPSRRRAEDEELQINSRYPERDAARRAVLKMSSTLHSLDEDSMQFFGARDVDDGDDDNNDASSAGEGSEGGIASSQLRGKRRNGNRYRVLPQKRDREPSIDSSISNESLREVPYGRGKEAESLLVEHSSSSTSSAGCMSEGEARRVNRNAKESTAKNVPINHYLNNVMQSGGAEEKKGSNRKRGKGHRRRLEDMFLGLDESNSGVGAAGATDADQNNGSQFRAEAPAPLGDITPLNVDASVSFEKVGGLPGHVVLLREMVLFPLLYPDVLRAMNLTPPRGVLFVGPPGTGKTLMARALANEGTHCAHRKVTFFMRKGADILSKWVGESERQLSLLFEEAKRQQPSIIFFDEMDGLVPVRHAKSEQSQAALVSTLLALIDGLDDRGQVVVIGATNRPDTIDPALRRPGRFDRELYFPLPDAAARRHILSIVTQPMLPADHPEREVILEELTTRCEGWSGAEIQALCTEAGLNRLRTSLPQLYTTSRKLQVPSSALTIEKEDFLMAAHRIKSSVRRGAASVVNSLEEHLEHLLHSTRKDLLSRVAALWPSAATALARERRDCSNANDAIQELSSFPIPHTANPLMLFLNAASSKSLYGSEACEFATEKAAIAFIKALPSLRTFTLHLPHLVVDYSNAAVVAATSTGMTSSGESNEQEACNASHGGSFDTGHIYSCIAALQRSSGPLLVLLQGLDIWLAEHGLPSDHSGANFTDEERAERQRHMEALCYYLNLLRDLDVLVVVPTLHVDVISRFFGDSRLNTQLRTTECVAPCVPTEADLRRFLLYVYRVVKLALLHCAPARWVELPDDVSPPPPPSMEQVRATRHRDLAFWRRVEYRRRQLRYVLTKWVGQYINSRKFSLFLSADLDFTPGHDFYDEWQQHTHGRRIGLRDVMEKLENEEYTSLSQYHDDIDLLVRNVRTFFRTRSMTDQRYRSRALELKEMTVLNLYKINRNVVQFCEQYRDLAEPDISSSSASSDDGAEKIVTQPAVRIPIKRNVRSRVGRSRRRRRIARPARPAAAIASQEDAPKKEEEEEGEEEKEKKEEEVTIGEATAVTPEGEAEEKEKKEEEVTIGEATAVTPEGEAEEKVKADADAFTTSNNNNKTTINDADTAPQSDGIAEIDAAAEALQGLSFLHLHWVFQAAMPFLEAEVCRRRRRQPQLQEGETSLFPSETNVQGSASFFQWMMGEALQETHKVRNNVSSKKGARQ